MAQVCCSAVRRCYVTKNINIPNKNLAPELTSFNQAVHRLRDKNLETQSHFAGIPNEELGQVSLMS